MRIGNIEYRKVGDNWEIVQWYPNLYYGKESEYTYDPGSECYTKPGSCVNISKSCFACPESCIVIAFVVWNKSHDEFDIRSVGTRPWHLDEDTESFNRIISYLEGCCGYPDEDTDYTEAMATLIARIKCIQERVSGDEISKAHADEAMRQVDRLIPAIAYVANKKED